MSVFSIKLRYIGQAFLITNTCAPSVTVSLSYQSLLVNDQMLSAVVYSIQGLYFYPPSPKGGKKISVNLNFWKQILAFTGIKRIITPCKVNFVKNV